MDSACQRPEEHALKDGQLDSAGETDVARKQKEEESCWKHSSKLCEARR